MNKALAEELIHIEAELIREKMKDGTLYGEKIDLQNLDHVIVAAYYRGRGDATDLWVQMREIDKHLLWK